MPLKRYSKKEPQVFLWIMIPYIFFLNALIFGTCIFNSAGIFARAFLYSAIFILIVYFVFGVAATMLKNRFSGDSELFKRIGILLPIFYVMNTIAMSGIIYLYEKLTVLPCSPRSGMLPWAILYGCIMSTMITFMNEGAANWEAWKSSLSETERLKNVYQRSKVLGLKGQINPHFLFNCFNTLSGLIQDDQEKAETFLDEMTKVHRYLLRSDDELLVSLDKEIKFAHSYLYLAGARFGDAIHYTINIGKEALDKELPPLSLQVILENIIHNNALSKANPLSLKITTRDVKTLSVVNSIREKTIVPSENTDDGLDNLLDKYRILNAGAVIIQENGSERSLLLPLFDHKAGLI